MVQSCQQNDYILELSSRRKWWDQIWRLQNMKEIQFHVFLHRLIGQEENSKKFITGSPLCYTIAYIGLSISGKNRWMRS
jgi:hypothetical protein